MFYETFPMVGSIKPDALRRSSNEHSCLWRLIRSTANRRGPLEESKDLEVSWGLDTPLTKPL
jgi:hypothetical protein